MEKVVAGGLVGALATGGGFGQWSSLFAGRIFCT
jgi:hypothetical protein